MADSGDSSNDSQVESDYTDNQDSNSDDNISNDDSHGQGVNTFTNDGSFMEQFKRRIEEAKVKNSRSADNNNPPNDNEQGTSNVSNVEVKTEESTEVQNKKKPAFFSLVGKRRGGKILKTGIVKKTKSTEEDPENQPKDAWSRYLAEVRQYKQLSCEEEGKTRPLVK